MRNKKAKQLKRVANSALIQVDPVGKPKYMITSLGINTVLGLMTKTVNNTLNY